MPGANGLVAFDGCPANVPESLIHAIRRRVNAINAAGGELLESLRSGDTVTIQDGPFAGYRAIFDSRICGSRSRAGPADLAAETASPVGIIGGTDPAIMQNPSPARKGRRLEFASHRRKEIF